MNFEINNALEVLERTPKIVHALLHDLPPQWTHENEGENTWSPFDVIGHLIHGEQTDWIVRAKIILQGDKVEFEVFDRFAQFENSKGKNLHQLLNEFEQLRVENIESGNVYYADTQNPEELSPGDEGDLYIVFVQK